jgi:hypothetical protein
VKNGAVALERLLEGEKNGTAKNQFAEGLAAKLERKLGTGDRPEARRAFYRRLELATEVHGERVWTQLRIILAEAAEKRSPDRYFCRTALCRLRESGLMPMADL